MVRRDRALPSDLSLRTFVLLLLVLASAGAIYGQLWSLAGAGTTVATQQCLANLDISQIAGISPLLANQMRHSAALLLACARPDTGGLTAASAVGALLVSVAGWLIYRLMPLWRMYFGNGFWHLVSPRRNRPGRIPLTPISETEHPGVPARLVGLAGTLGVPVPEFVFARYAKDAYTFGAGRRTVVALTPGVLALRDAVPERFDGVVLHELGHVRNRDNRSTYLAIGLWYSFLALALVPYVAALVLSYWLPESPPGGSGIHITLVVAALSALVLIVRNDVLRTRELGADVAAGRFAQAAMASWLAAQPDEPSSRVPPFLRRHPTQRQRRRAIRDPFDLDTYPGMQLFVGGIAVSTLGADLILLLWHGLLALPVPIGPGTFAIAVVLIAFASLTSVAVIAWLTSMTAWRARLAGQVRPATVARLSIALAAGLLCGEPLSVTYANAGVWGVFDGVGGDGLTAMFEALTSVLYLVVLMVLLVAWSVTNAAGWIPVIRHSLRAGCIASAVVASLALFPVYVVWWMYHDAQIGAVVELWTPAVAAAFGGPYWPGPGASWLQAVYMPVDMLADLPGVSLLLTLPVLLSTAAMLRRPMTEAGAMTPTPAGPPRLGRSILCGSIGGLAAIVVGALFVVWVRQRVGVDAIHRDQGAATVYFADVLVDVGIAVAVLVAIILALVLRRGGPILGLLAAGFTANVAAIGVPALVLVGICGPRRAPYCADGILGQFYETGYGVAAPRAPVKATLIGAVLLCLVALIRSRRHSTGPVNGYVDTDAVAPARRGSVAALMLLGAALVAGTYYGILALLP